MRVLYLSYDGMTDPLGQSQVLPYLIGLTQKGASITLISFEKATRFAAGKAKIQALCDANNIQWKPLDYHATPPVISTIKDLKAMTKMAEVLHREKSFDIIHCRSYISALVGLKFKRKYGVRFLFDMRGFWADERVDGNIWSLSNPVFKRVYKYFKKKERQFFIESDACVSLTETGKDEILSWKLPHVTADKFEVIPCCTDLAHFDPEKLVPEKVHALRNQLKLTSNHFVLSYLGSIGTWYLLDEMLAFFKLLLQQKPEAIFLFITADAPESIYEAAEKMGIQRDQIRIQMAPRADVPSILSLSNLSIFFIKDAYSKKASCPTKMGETMALGIPIICNERVGDVGTIVEKYQVGLAVEDFEDTTLQAACDQVDEVLKLPKATIKAGANEYFSLANGVDQYWKIYQKLTA